MKQILTLLILVCASSMTFAQAPQKMTYQAVVRDASDALVSNTSVGMQISILQSTPTGIAVYIETHSPTTNINGLATVEIGGGTVVAGSFSAIDWANGPYYLKTETDPTGGTTYSISGTTQLLSVPYALYAETSGSGGGSESDPVFSSSPAGGITAGDISNWNNDLVDDADADPSNELQTVSVAGSTLTLSNGGGSVSINDADSDPSNELQTLSLSGSDLTISGGNTVTLPGGGGGGNTLDQAYDQGGAGAGRVITVDAGEVEMNTATSNGIALRTQNTNTGVALLASSTNSANTFSTIQSATNSSSTNASAVIGSTTGAAWGVSGQVASSATATSAVYGNNLRTNGGHGVYGVGHNGLVGETNYQLGFGVYGYNYDAIGPIGNAVGTYGYGYVGVWGDDSGIGGFSVYANGDLGAAGVKSFQIDHPTDPENKYLRHFSIESDEVLNMYRGTVEFDQNGEVVVELPDYVEDVNINYSYTLTPVGGYAPLYVKEEIKDGKFVIAGGDPSMKVSWVVYGERNDPYLQQHPEKRAVEPDKEDWNKGKYLKPELFDQPDSKKIVKPIDQKPAEPIKIMD